MATTGVLLAQCFPQMVLHRPQVYDDLQGVLVSRGLPQTEKPVKGSMRQKSLGTSVLAHCHDEFREPRSDYVRLALATVHTAK
ncbi:hypothetical protein TNCV_1756051 [Trichonephila clavipes]|nr:hypothetical protein TNCV_1756051 [Trichonephila clavipes]